jgi:hypothetical protein
VLTGVDHHLADRVAWVSIVVSEHRPGDLQL